MPQCNLDARGKAVRLIGGSITVLGSIIAGALLLAGVLPATTISSVGLAGAFFGGLFAIYEGRTGWCIIRAMGIKTPL